MTIRRIPGLVLVLDDVEGNRVLAEAYLQRLGWQTICFAHPAAALEFLAHTLPEAILADVRMPGMSGDELARQLRAREETRGVRMVAYTAHALRDEIAGFHDAGFDAVVIKPALIDDFRRALPPPTA